MCACAFVCMCVLYDFEEGAFTKKMYVLLSCLRIAAYYFLLRRLFFHSKKPYTIPKESYFLTKEPYLVSKEPYLLSKELYLFSKEPCLLSKEPNPLPKEPYLQETSGQHVRATARKRELVLLEQASLRASDGVGTVKTIKRSAIASLRTHDCTFFPLDWEKCDSQSAHRR